MKSSRESRSSLSSVLSDRTSDRNRSKSRSSRESVESLRKSNKKMKFIIAVGVALPIIAAIIGVVAWTVSADSAFHGPSVSSLRRSDAASQEEDIFQILEDRHDMTYTRHPSPFDSEEPHRNDLSRLDGLHHPSVHQNTFDDPPEKDPLYIVHFVPSPKPARGLKSSTPGPVSASTVSNEVLQKILSASKGTKPGTPQFVVFAPMPSAEDNKDKDDDLTGMGATGLNFLAKPPTPHTEIDYDYEEELRKYQEMLNNKEDNVVKDTSRIGTSTDRSNTQTQIRKESHHVAAQNITIGNLYKSLLQHQPRSVGSNVDLHTSEFNKQSQQIYPQNVLQSPSAFTEAVQNGHQQAVFNQPQLNFNQPPPQDGYNQPQQLYAPSSLQQGTNYPLQQATNYPVQQATNYPVQQQVQQQQQRSGLQPAATDRSGYESPLAGIKLSLGGADGHGQKSLLGGSYSPLGIISSILAPVIRRPRVNLNGKLMFGVMLEKGVKFGQDKGHHHQPQVAYG